MKYSVNDKLHGFVVRKASRVDEVNADAYLMEHEKSGARLLYLDSPDDNKCFYIGFRTPPDNSKGTPHIMEHSTLCGSRKYPLKEPFVELAKGSLNTFLNAMTWPDKTLYPVASRNDVDFKNLMDVYLDAVFFPNCLKDKEILMQEGWHYELEDKDAPLTYKGVVYNEMKGALSDPGALLEDKAMAALFPDTTYSVESGGDPEVIPTLTFREFTEFHRRFYHASNSYIFLYGNMDIAKTLALIDGEYLSHFDRHPVDSAIGTEPPFDKRKVVEGTYGISDGESEAGKTMHSLYVAMSDHVPAEDSLAFRILNYALLDMEGAPLKKALVDAGIGSDVSGQYEDGIKQPVWEIDVTGSEPEKRDAFASITDSTIRSLALSGIDKDILTAALNRTEFLLRESDYQGQPKGLFYGVRAMDSWLYDKDPIEGLRYAQALKDIRSRLHEGYFENLLVKYVLRNNHQVLVTMKPEKGLTERKNQRTAEQLKKYKESLTDAQLEEIIESTKALKKRQATPDSPEALATIPLLSRKDLKRTVEDSVLEEGKEEGITHLHYRTDTAGISYFNLYFTLYGLKGEDIRYAFLLADLLGAVDTKDHSYRDLSRLSNTYTGGLSFQVAAFSDKADDHAYVPVMLVKGKGLTSQAGHLGSLLGEIMNRTVFTDTERLKEILQEKKAGWDMTVFGRGHRLVMNRLLSYFSPVEQFREQGGLSYYYFLGDLVKLDDKGLAALGEKLAALSASIFTKTALTLESVGGDEEKAAAAASVKSLTDGMAEGTPADTLSFVFPKTGINEGFLTSGKVQYVAKGGNFRRHGFAYTGALQVMTSILQYEYLWRRVRIQGGAYGAFSQFSMNGNGLICSFRDPNLKETLEVYKALPEYLANFTVSDREMTKYVIGAMAPAEMQLTPAMKGDRAMMYRLSHITKEDRQKTREEIIDCTVQDIRALAPMMESIFSEPYLCVMGSEGKIQEEKDLFQHILSLPQ